MPRLRKYNKKRKYSKIKTSLRRTGYVGYQRIPRLVSKDVHSFKRMTYKGTISPVPGNVAYGAYTFQLSDTPDYTEFTALFDYFKITGVKLKFSLNLDPTAQLAANAQWPIMYSCVDYDDSQVPANANELRVRTNCKQHILAPNRFYSIYLKPKYLKKVSYGLASDGYEIGKQQWLDLATPDLPHYAWKYAVENMLQTGGQSIRVEAIYYLKFKGVR